MVLVLNTIKYKGQTKYWVLSVEGALDSVIWSVHIGQTFFQFLFSTSIDLNCTNFVQHKNIIHFGGFPKPIRTLIHRVLSCQGLQFLVIKLTFHALGARRDKMKTQLWYATMCALHGTPSNEEIAEITLIVGRTTITYKTIVKKKLNISSNQFS